METVSMNRKFPALRSVALGVSILMFCSSCSSGHWQTEYLSNYTYVSEEVPGSVTSQNSMPDGNSNSDNMPGSSVAESGSQSPGSPDSVTANTNKGYLNADKYGIYNAFLTYVCKGNTTFNHTEEAFLPSVAYIENGQIKDIMFDTFIFLPNVNYIYDYGPDDGGRAPLKKSDWQAYIRLHQFSPGNMGALDSATAKMKEALGKDNYKTNIIMPLFYPVKSVTNFGIVDGVNLNLSKLEDRKAAVKWFVDTQIQEFEAKNYQNLKTVGFYWFTEAIDSDDTDTIKLIHYITDYVRQKGYISLWLPYFHAKGYSTWKDFGFDLVAMQPNFFPTSTTPNAGGEERLKYTADDAVRYNMGYEIESEYNTEASVTNLKKYYRGGVNFGYINAFHTFYMQQGPSILYDFYSSTDEYMKSAYTDTYRFISKTLDVKDMIIR